MPCRPPHRTDWWFHHHDTSNKIFVHPIWPKFSIGLYTAYRVVLAVYFFIWLILSWFSGVVESHGNWNSIWRFYIYVTCWTYTIFTAYLVVAAVNCVHFHWPRLVGSSHSRAHESVRGSATPRMGLSPVFVASDDSLAQPSAAANGAKTGIATFPVAILTDGGQIAAVVRSKHRVQRRFALQWFLFNIAVCCEPIVAVVYWTLLYPQLKNKMPLFDAISNVHLHLLCAIVILIDVMVIRVPIRWPHISHCVVYAVIYLVFNILYVCAIGATDAGGNHWIYPILDWRAHLSNAVVMGLLIVFVGVPIGWLVAWGLFKLRQRIFRRRYLTASSLLTAPHYNVTVSHANADNMNPYGNGFGGGGGGGGAKNDLEIIRDDVFQTNSADGSGGFLHSNRVGQHAFSSLTDYEPVVVDSTSYYATSNPSSPQPSSTTVHHTEIGVNHLAEPVSQSGTEHQAPPPEERYIS